MYAIIVLVLFSNLAELQGANLIKDNSHNLSMTFSSKKDSTGTQIISFRFRFPDTKSPALTYGGFFGAEFKTITFPNTANSFDCELKDQSVSYIISPALTIASTFSTKPINTSTLYCQFLDQTTENLVSGKTYTLTITLNTIISNSFIEQISFFTTTTNNADQMILDYLPVWGAIGFIPSINQVISLVDVKFDVSSGGGITSGTVIPSSGVMYPYMTFDLILTILIRAEFSILSKDYSWQIKYNNAIYEFTTNVTSEDNSTQTLHKALKGSLSAAKINSDTIEIKPEENLFDNRVFKIRFSGVRTLDTGVGLVNNFESFIYYKNTYTLLSYDILNANNVNPVPIKGPNNGVLPSVHHPEWFAIFDGMGWPIKFTFTFTDTAAQGGYLVIRQKNTIDTSSRWVFVASSCDFTNGFSEQGIGKRNQCYPLRNDFKYTTSLGGGAEYEGHGIFFKMNSANSNQTYEMTVWGFAERCGTTTDPTAAVTTYYTNFAFNMRLYKDIFLDGYLDEARLVNSNNNVIAQALNFSMSEKCFAGQHLDPSNIGKFSPSANNLYTHETSIFLTTAKTDKVIDPTSNATMKSSGYSYWGENLTFQDGASATKRSTGAITEKFLFSSASFIGIESYLVLSKFTVMDVANLVSDSITNWIPSECSNTTAGNLFTSGRWEFIFSKDWFVKGDDYKSLGCFAAVAYYNNYDDVASPLAAPLTKSSWQKLIPNNFNANGDDNAATVNFVYSKLTGFPNTPPVESIDTVNTTLPPHILESETGRTSTLRLVSIKDTVDGGNNRSHFSTVRNCNDAITYNSVGANRYRPNFVEHGFMTTCLKWKNTPPNIRSLYTYFDVQWHNVVQPGSFSLDDPITRVWRYIKLYPEAGIFQDPAEKIYKSLTDERLVTGHYAWTAAKESPWAVCLIEINGKALSSSYTSLSNTLIIWLFATSLLDIDYSDPGSLYPVSPLASNNLQAYAFNSGQTISTMNRLTSEIAAGPTISNVTNQPNTYLDQLWFLTNANYNAPATTKFSIYEANRTMYQFYLGSAIYITGFTSNKVTTSEVSPTTYPPLLIPFLCPQHSDSTATTYGTAGVAFSIPTVMVQWATVTSHSDILSINSILSDGTQSGINIFSDLNQKDSIGGNAWQLAAIPLYKGVNTGTLAAQNNWSGQTTTQTLASTYNRVTLRFHAYEPSTLASNELFLFPLAASKITSLALFANSYLSLDTTNNYITGIGAMNRLYSTIVSEKTDFYIRGKKYKYMALGSISPTWNAGTTRQIIPAEIDLVITALAATSAYNIVGINRPSLTDFLPNDTNATVNRFNGLNFLGITGANAVGDSTNKIMTSFAYDDALATGKLQDFYLDYNPYSSNWSVLTIINDTSQPVYNVDTAGATLVSFLTPTTIPEGATIEITYTSGSLIVPGKTVCGMQEGSQLVATDCSITSNVVACPNTRSLTDNFKVCCYNSALNQDIIDVLSTRIVIPYLSEYSNMNTYVSDHLYSTLTNPANSFNTNQSAAPNLVSSKVKGKISRLIYSHTSQLKSFGYVQIQATLPRSIVRGGTLEIVSSKFSGFSPNNESQINTEIEPRCESIVGSNIISNGINSSEDFYSQIDWSNGNFLVEACFFNTSIGMISVKFKNIIYKCSINLSSDIVIILSPILVVDMSSSNNNGSTPNNASVSLYSVNSQKLISDDDQMFSQDGVLTTESILDNSKLCDVTRIYPLMVGEYADYTFVFDLPDIDDMNEISIFFNYDLFGGDIKDIACLYNNIAQNCSFSTKGLLNIRFDSSLPKETKVEIVIAGIYNPVNTQGKTFLCTVNSTNFSTDSRINLVKGQGTISQDTYLALNNAVANTKVKASGALFVLNNPLYTMFEPRQTPVLHIEVGFDKNYKDKNIIIKDNPRFIVTLPKQFKSTWYANQMNIMKANLTEIQIETFDNSETIYRTFPNVISKITGNKLEFPLGIDESEFFTRANYWKIILDGLVTPPEETIDLFSETSSKFEVTLTNDLNDVFFTTYDNINSLASKTPLREPIDEYLNYYRGIEYKFSSNLWVLDILDSDNVKNYITLHPGRYGKYFFNIRNEQDTSITPDQSLIELKHSLFKTFKANYLVSSSLKAKIPFLIGIQCGKPFGNYLINFTYTTDFSINPPIINPRYFTAISPIQVLVNKNFPKATIGIQTPSSIPIAGSSIISYKLEEPNVDAFSISWSPETASTKIEKVDIPESTESMNTLYKSTNSTLGSSITFAPILQNDCYSFAQNDLTLNILGITAVIPQSGITQSDFKYFNSETDANLATEGGVNSIKMVLTTEYKPIFVYCVMTCLDKDFPDNDFLKNVNIDKFTNDTHSFVATYFAPENEQVNLIFQNLLRRVNYKMKCVIESTESDVVVRTSSIVEMTNDTNLLSNGTVQTLDLKPTTSHETWCAKYKFGSEPGEPTKEIIRKECQNVFSGNSWELSGCGICTDIFGNMNPGFSLPNSTTCASLISNFQPEPVLVASETQLKTFFYSACVVPHPQCKSTFDLGVNSYESLFNVFTSGLSVREHFEALKIDNIVDVSVETTKDNVFPEKPTAREINFNDVSREFTFNLFSEVNLICYYQLLTGESPVTTIDTIIGCSYESSAGNSVVSSTGFNSTCGVAKSDGFGVANTVRYQNSINTTLTFNMFATCFPEFPYPSVVNQEPVLLFTKLYNFVSDIVDPSDFTDVIIDIGSGYLSSSFSIMLLILALWLF